MTESQVIEIRQTPRGGWYALNRAAGQDTLRNTRKSRRGAISQAKRFWGEGIEIRDGEKYQTATFRRRRGTS